MVYITALKVSLQKVTKYDSFEYMEILLSTDSDVVRLIVLYRPPSGGKKGVSILSGNPSVS